jgi:hypothetical protein
MMGLKMVKFFSGVREEAEIMPYFQERSNPFNPCADLWICGPSDV